MSEQITTKEEPEMVDTEVEVVEPTKFVKKAMILEAAGTVHSVLSLPNDFVMPGFLLIEITDGTVCEPGMSYSKETGEFAIVEEPEAPEPQEKDPVNEPENPTAEQ